MEVVAGGHWGSAEESCDDSSESGSMEKGQKGDNASTETVENQEIALQWFMTGPPLMGWSEISALAHWGREEKARGCRSQTQWSRGRRAWKGAMCPCSARPYPYMLAQLCPASGVEFLTNPEAREFISEMWQFTVGNHENPLALICLSFPSGNAD